MIFQPSEQARPIAHIEIRGDARDGSTQIKQII